MMQQHQQNHATWECKYHVVFIPKYRKKAIFGNCPGWATAGFGEKILSTEETGSDSSIG